jgi:selenocysteine lyase/cysteine desulfurase
VALTHASHVTGRVFDVAPLFAMAKSIGARTLLDASQTVGEVPVCPDELGADMVAFPGHKRLRGPSGTGGLYIDPRLVLSPVFTSTARSRTGLITHTPPELPAGFETGRPDVTAFAGLCAALQWHEKEGEVCQREGQRLAQLLRRELRRIRGVRIVGDAKRAQRVPVMSLRIAGRGAEEIRDELEIGFGIRCSAGLHAAPLIHKAIGSSPEGTVRFGVSGFNTEDEIRYLLQALRWVASGRPRPLLACRAGTSQDASVPQLACGHRADSSIMRTHF